jgi:hypothetical protein
MRIQKRRAIGHPLFFVFLAIIIIGIVALYFVVSDHYKSVPTQDYFSMSCGTLRQTINNDLNAGQSGAAVPLLSIYQQKGCSATP